MKRRSLFFAAVIASLPLIVGLGGLLGRSSAQGVQEVAPYKIGEIPGDGVYKLVHHGCALYVARERVFQINHGDAVTLAIATGEGCK